jgi:hypothetical protein
MLAWCGTSQSMSDFCRAVGFQRLVDDAVERVDRHLEYGVAFHPHQRGFVHAGRRAGRGAQQFLVAAVGVDVGGDDAGLVGCAQHHRTGAVAPQDAVAAVVPVGDARQRFGADHQHVFGRAGLDELVGHAQCVDEAAAHGLQVERRLAVGHAELGLHDAGGAGENQVGRGGGDQQQVDIVDRQAGRIERGARRLSRQIAGELAFGGNMTLADAGAIDDPLIVRLDQLFEIGVGEDAGRQIAAGAENAGIGQAATR